MAGVDDDGSRLELHEAFAQLARPGMREIVHAAERDVELPAADRFHRGPQVAPHADLDRKPLRQIGEFVDQLERAEPQVTPDVDAQRCADTGDGGEGGVGL
jgi:hypothetical protein